MVPLPTWPNASDATTTKNTTRRREQPRIIQPPKKNLTAINNSSPKRKATPRMLLHHFPLVKWADALGHQRLDRRSRISCSVQLASRTEGLSRNKVSPWRRPFDFQGSLSTLKKPRTLELKTRGGMSYFLIGFALKLRF